MLRVAAALVCLLGLSQPIHARSPSQRVSKEALFQRASQLAKKRQYSAAQKLFGQLLTRFSRAQRAHKPGSHTWQQMQVGQCGTLQEMGQLFWQQKQAARACRSHLRLVACYQKIAPKWKKLLQRAPIGKQLQRSLSQDKERCKMVPSTLLFTLQPPKAKLMVQHKGAWKLVPRGLLHTLQTRVTIKATAPGYLVTTKRVQAPRWQRTQVTIALAPAPAPPPRPTKRPATRPAPRQPAVALKVAARIPKPLRPNGVRALPKPKATTPFYRTWWFWTITGTLAAGGTAAIIAGVVAQNQPLFRDDDPASPYRLWK